MDKINYQSKYELDNLIKSLRAHYAVLAKGYNAKNDKHNDKTEQSLNKLTDALNRYDESLITDFGEVTPFEVVTEEEMFEQITDILKTSPYDDDEDDYDDESMYELDQEKRRKQDDEDFRSLFLDIEDIDPLDLDGDGDPDIFDEALDNY
ncbi:MAG: hypothetical protein LBN03_02355 [Bifidobacteriaceae bacterium]|jgi:hypothetical protein|nr:hypothetical protein [Bifidobacteriaceae bacterium]